jgi:hypothetical protein
MTLKVTTGITNVPPQRSRIHPDTGTVSFGNWVSLVSIIMEPLNQGKDVTVILSVQ